MHARLPQRLVLLLALACAVPAWSQPNSVAFGRFGRINDDGLLTCNVTPNWISLPPTVRNPFRVWFADGTAQATVQRLNSTEKVLQLTGGGTAPPSHVRYTLLYPGVSVRFPGREARLKITDYSGNPFRFSLFLGAKTQASRSVLLFPANEEGTPVQIFCPQAKNPVFSVGNELRIAADSPIGEVRLLTPFGTDDRPGLLKQKAALERAMRQWEERGLPTRISYKTELSADGRFVTITETFQTERGAPIAPLPPVLIFAKERGYPIQIQGRLVKTACRTKWGAFAYVPGNVARYTLPVPPIEERGYVRVESPPERLRLLNDLVGHLGGEWAKNGVDLGYAGMTNAQMAWVYLTPTKQREVAAAWRKYLPLTFLFPPYPPTDKRQTWKIETEPFTRQSYLWTYFINGPGKYKYDIEWGNALPLYGLYKYAQYTGDWGLARRVWAKVPRLYRYLDLGDDWAWMTVVNADHGFSTGTGDPMDAAYCGTVACLKMARALGDRAAERRYAAKVACIAVPTAARLWYTAWARKCNFIGRQSVVLGFHETEGFTRSRVQDDDPWAATSVLSGDGVQPELFDLFNAYAQDGLKEFLRLYAQGFPNWYKANHVYPFRTTYKGNSVYVTFPHIYARATLGEPLERLWDYVESAESNRNNAWIGPNVMAELLSADAPLLLTEWRPAAYLDGKVSADRKSATLTFRLAAPTDWTLTAQLKSNAMPKTVTLNGEPIPFEAANGRLRLRLRTQGELKVEVAF